jgi:hypothetical protein
MACSLEKDSSGAFNFTAKNHATPTVRVTALNGNARLASARLNESDLTVQNEDSVTFPIGLGKNNLRLVINVADPNDTIRILEVCDSGQNQVLREFPNDPNDPVTGFRILGV